MTWLSMIPYSCWLSAPFVHMNRAVVMDRPNRACGNESEESLCWNELLMLNIEGL